MNDYSKWISPQPVSVRGYDFQEKFESLLSAKMGPPIIWVPGQRIPSAQAS
jgi:hypothetical protein